MKVVQSLYINITLVIVFYSLSSMNGSSSFEWWDHFYQLEEIFFVPTSIAPTNKLKGTCDHIP